MLLFMAIRYMYRLANVRERRLLIWRRNSKNLNKRRRKMKKEDRQIEWKLDWLCYAGFYKEYKIFECFEWEKSQWEVNLILGNFKTKIGTYTTCKSAKRGAERFLKRLQEAVK